MTSSIFSAGAASDRKGHRLGTMCGEEREQGGAIPLPNKSSNQSIMVDAVILYVEP
jgi:hypothetical protein